jgi:hypothetical protein
LKFVYPDAVDELVAHDAFAFDTRYGALDVLKWAPNAWDFDAISGRAEHLLVGDMLVPVAHLDNLIAMKRFADRPNDRVVLPMLLESQHRRRSSPHRR